MPFTYHAETKRSQGIEIMRDITDIVVGEDDRRMRKKTLPEKDYCKKEQEKDAESIF